jgi:hypothetical protein
VIRHTAIAAVTAAKWISVLTSTIVDTVATYALFQSMLYLAAQQEDVALQHAQQVMPTATIT